MASVCEAAVNGLTRNLAVTDGPKGLLRRLHYLPA